MAGLRADILSPVKETGTLLGVVSSQAAELCGLKVGTPVVVGGGDAAWLPGLGVVRPAQTAVLGGTFWQQVVNLAAPVTDPEMNVRVNPHVIPGMVQAESISFLPDSPCAGSAMLSVPKKTDCRTFRHRHLYAAGRDGQSGAAWVVGRNADLPDRMRFKTGITLRLPLLICPLTRINVTKRHCSVRWKKMRRLYQRVTCSKLLIFRIFILHR